MPSCLVSHALERPRTFVHTHAGEIVAPAVIAQVRELIGRRRAGEPVAYILGTREFWSLELELDKSVLIPRPETELLVEFALEVLPAEAHSRVLELGTGSGAVALAIARERPHARVTATDVSAQALVLACRNAEQLEIGNVTFVAGSWYDTVGRHALRSHRVESTLCPRRRSGTYHGRYESRATSCAFTGSNRSRGHRADPGARPRAPAFRRMARGRARRRTGCGRSRAVFAARFEYHTHPSGSGWTRARDRRTQLTPQHESPSCHRQCCSRLRSANSPSSSSPKTPRSASRTSCAMSTTAFSTARSSTASFRGSSSRAAD